MRRIDRYIVVLLTAIFMAGVSTSCGILEPETKMHGKVMNNDQDRWKGNIHLPGQENNPVLTFDMMPGYEKDGTLQASTTYHCYVSSPDGRRAWEFEITPNAVPGDAEYYNGSKVDWVLHLPGNFQP
jgi:hypothetical protein